ncbi:MAG: alpha/beta fold hydrolase [Spirochaetia bacterium]|nr:alpha/beta fold hydrolase [Spirochaetia bacterium]
MPVFHVTDYLPSLLFKNRHFNTIYQTAFRKVNHIPYERKRIKTPDKDFLDIDLLKTGSKSVAILCHGLEGSSKAKYILATAAILRENKIDVVAMNYRGCSGEPNKKVFFYHSGKTDDLDLIIKNVQKDYKEIFLIGFSLGGNLILKYLGDNSIKKSSKIKKACAVSVPCDLSSASDNLSKLSNYIYKKRFFRRFQEKIIKKMKIMPKKISVEPFKQVKSMRDYDDAYVAPFFGYKDAEDYYQKESCKKFIPRIKNSTLIVNALDDPILTEKCHPIEEAENSKYVRLELSKYGGHVGFCNFGKEPYWVEKRVIGFIKY